MFERLVVLLRLFEVQILANIPQADLMNLLVHQVHLSFVLLAQFLAESEQLLDRGVVVLLLGVLGDEEMDVPNQLLA